MFASALFFFNVRDRVGQKYQLAFVVSALVVSIAGYHYYRIFHSWRSGWLDDRRYLSEASIWSIGICDHQLSIINYQLSTINW